MNCGNASLMCLRPRSSIQNMIKYSNRWDICILIIPIYIYKSIHIYIFFYLIIPISIFFFLLLLLFLGSFFQLYFTRILSYFKSPISNQSSFFLITLFAYVSVPYLIYFLALFDSTFVLKNNFILQYPYACEFI